MSRLEEERRGCEETEDLDSDIDEDEEEEKPRGGRRDWQRKTDIERVRQDDSDTEDIGEGEAIEEVDEDQNEEVDHIPPLEVQQPPPEPEQHEHKQEEVQDEQVLIEESQENVVSEELEGDEENHAVVEEQEKEEDEDEEKDEEEEEEDEDESPRSRFKSERSSEGSKISLTTTKTSRNITGTLDDIIKEKKIVVEDTRGQNRGRGGRGGQNYGRGGRGMARGSPGGQMGSPRFQQGAMNRYQGQMAQQGFQVQQWGHSIGLMGPRPRGMGMFSPNQQSPMQMQMSMQGQIQTPGVGMVSSAFKLFDMMNTMNAARFRMNGPNDGIRFPMNNAGVAGQQLQNQNVSRPVNPVPQQPAMQSSAHSYLKNFGNTNTGVVNKSDMRSSFGTGNTQTGVLDKGDLRNSIGTGRDIRSRLGGYATTNQDVRALLEAGKQGNSGDLRSQLGGADQDLRSVIARGLAGRQTGVTLKAASQAKRPHSGKVIGSKASVKQIKLHLPSNKNAITVLHQMCKSPINFVEKQNLMNEFECVIQVEGQTHKGVGGQKKVAKKYAAEATLEGLMQNWSRGILPGPEIRHDMLQELVNEHSC